MIGRNLTKRRRYASSIEDNGENYRHIAETMSKLGYPMNHSCVMNNVVNVMKVFVSVYAECIWNERLTEAEIVQIAKDPEFQSTVSELLHAVESQFRKERARSTIVTDHGTVRDQIATETHACTAPETSKDDSRVLAH